jgi:hypothetical protein
MSEFIDVISPKALEQLKLANAEIVTMVSNVKKVNENLIGAKTPSGSDSALKSLTAEYQKQEQAIVKVQKQLEKARLEEIKLQQAREKAFDKYEAQLTKEQAKLQASENLYNKVQAKLNTLSNEYKALATRKELGIALTDKEAQRYDFLQGKIQTYDKTLKAVDATMGKYQRNVGNYASGFSPLSNSINQLTREMPAFTYSVQTGFMALSNNIPIFTDAISQAIAQNKELQAQGQPTTSVLEQLADGVFSWQTLLGVGITLLTVYGEEIGEWFNNTMRAGNATKYLAEATKDLKDAQTEALKSIAKEKIELQTLLAIARDETKSKEQRLLAVEKLQKQYPEYFGNLSKEKILAGETAKAEQALTNALLQRARAQAVLGKITENEIAIIDLLDKEREQVLKLNDAIKEEKRVKALLKDEIGAEAVSLRKQAEDRRKFAEEQRNQTIQEIEDRRRRSEFLSKSVKDETVLIKENTSNIEKNTKAKKEAETYAIGSVKWIKQQINQIQELNDTLSKNSEEYQVGVGAIKFYEAWLKRLTETAKKTEKEIDGISLNLSDIKPMTDEEGDELMEAGNRLREMLKNFKQGFIDEFGQESGFSKTLSILSGGLKKFEGDSVATALAISEAFQEAFNTISQYSQANFEQQYANLEQQKKVAILFAGESTTAREEIERQYEEKRRAIQNRQAEAQKRLALFNIATDMAQAIVASFKTDPTGILAIAIGAIGAFQLGLVASQQIPQFYKGTDNAPEGWAWTQEKGAEIITDKSGRVKDTGSNGGAKLTYLSKGDKVFTAEQSKNIMFNKELNSILNNNGILPTNVINNKLDLSPLRSDIRSLENTIKNKSELHMISDRQGERVYQKEQGKRALLVSNRLRIK